MKRILIIGNDVHSKHYKDALFFRDELEIYFEQKEDINFYDYILFTLPLKFSSRYYNKIKNFKGILLIEKLQKKISLINRLKCKVYFIHLRDYNNILGIKLYNNKENLIKWPNLHEDAMNPILNTFPNILDFIYKEFSLKNDIKLVDFAKSKMNLHIEIKIDKYVFKIDIFNTTDSEILPICNDVQMQWPNYYKAINMLIDDLENGRLNFEFSKKRELDYNKIIKSMEDSYGIRKDKI